MTFEQLLATHISSAASETLSKIGAPWQLPPKACRPWPRSTGSIDPREVARLEPKSRPGGRAERRISKIQLVPRRGLSREEAADYIGISPSKFDELRKNGRIGHPRRIDGRKVWDIYQLDRDFESFPVEGKDEDEDWSTSL